MKEDAKPINENVDRKFTEEIKIKFAKIEEPETVEEIFELDNEKRRKDGIKKSEEEKIGEYKMERSKGGGEYCARIHQEFMHATEERGSMANLEESSMHT